MKLLSDCYAETILGVANLQGSFFETALKLLCRFLLWGLAVCWDPYLKMCSDCYAETILGVANLQGSFLKLLSDCDGGCQVAGILF